MACGVGGAVGGAFAEEERAGDPRVDNEGWIVDVWIDAAPCALVSRHLAVENLGGCSRESEE